MQLPIVQADNLYSCKIAVDHVQIADKSTIVDNVLCVNSPLTKYCWLNNMSTIGCVLICYFHTARVPPVNRQRRHGLCMKIFSTSCLAFPNVPLASWSRKDHPESKQKYVSNPRI